MRCILMIALVSIWLNATCIQMLNETDEWKGNIKISYCDGNKIQIYLKNKNQFLTDYSKMITLTEFNKMINGYKKTLKWYDKAKKMKITIDKNIFLIPNNLALDFDSRDNASFISIVIFGENSSVESGFFSISKRGKLADIISKLKNIKDNGKAKFKKQSSAFN